jgi:RimJ/RimL family protein N-acetyltransferase
MTQDKIILETQRLVLREVTFEDAPFIQKLVNTATWLEHIGERNVHSHDDALVYIKTGPMDNYEKLGFGLWLFMDKTNNQPMGLCGLLQRDNLDNPDIGFAMLPEYAGKGYGFEIAQATMVYAAETLGIKKVVGITSAQNIASIKLLNKIGLQFEGTILYANSQPSLLLSPPDYVADNKAIDLITKQFFEVFTNVGGQKPKVENIKKLFIPAGIIINNTNETPEIYSLDSFISPREKMLTNGTLTEFSEREVSDTTNIFGNISQRFSLYEKSGNLNGEHFETKGMKTMQFIKANKSWKLTSVAWSDENKDLS